ncbi:MAG: oxidoreductase, partial [Pseudomonadota bacterium]|nr:oxidoreductase [Pseudomonadota bacterium]
MSNTTSLAGKFALITGSTQGLGEATARLFAQRGAAGIIVTGRNAERGQAVADAVSTANCRVVFVPAELAEAQDCRRLIAAAEETFGILHVLVNAAALTERGSVWDTSPALFDRMMTINVRAPFLLMQDAIKLMERSKAAGSIVNISSVAAHGSVPMLTAYAASKGALDVLTKNIAYSVAWRRIRVNALNLGWMDTPNEDAIQRRYHSEG